MANRTLTILLAAICFLGASEAFSQFPPGGPFQGGPPMGGGPMMGGNFSPPGGRNMMGGSQRFNGRRDGRQGGRGRDRSSRFLERMLRRMDTNGDGVLRESEIPEERRGMFRMMSARFGIDASKGIQLDKLQETIQARRNNRSPSNNQAQSKQPEEDPLVPGFGIERELKPVLAFGVRDHSTDEVAQQSNQGQRQRGGSFHGRDNHDEESDQDTTTSSQDRSASYRFRSAHERLPEGLPSWFISRDTNMDGQVAMAEYARSWTSSTVADYYKYDSNRDGMITPEECLHPGDGTMQESLSKTREISRPARQPSSQPATKEKEEEVPWWEK